MMGNIGCPQSAELAWEGRRRRKPLEKRFNLRLSLLSRLLLSFPVFTIYFSATAASVWVGFFHHRGSFRVSDEAAWYDFSSSFLLHSLNSPPIFPWIGWSSVIGVIMEEASASAKDFLFEIVRKFMGVGVFFYDVCVRCFRWSALAFEWRQHVDIGKSRPETWGHLSEADWDFCCPDVSI